MVSSPSAMATLGTIPVSKLDVFIYDLATQVQRNSVLEKDIWHILGNGKSGNVGGGVRHDDWMKGLDGVGAEKSVYCSECVQGMKDVGRLWESRVRYLYFVEGYLLQRARPPTLGRSPLLGCLNTGRRIWSHIQGLEIISSACYCWIPGTRRTNRAR